ncbi:LacI family DNA-binding transcriptional regulator [Amaricoccus sp.]|uniref:LacI family DNA-binding transcriptional regulator n=1 Tax=Amaricoccus sp. TaxID=1872485 RepID=UPI001B74C634|nr:LacI family DNA-binding transcriptional regulator [Amaricoccus sp.]MBP7001334.1 LacI family DNA-binding transcriptional regulator [Amaricoccus sp.]
MARIAGGAARLADVAAAAGVSKATVSNVFNRPDVVSAAVQERVRAAAAELGYRGPDPKGRLLSAGKVNAIGVATSEPLSYFFEDPYSREMMTSVAAACEARGAGISLISAASERELAWNMKSALVDGFILFCLEDAGGLIEASRERRLPFVALAFGEGGEGASVVAVDDAAGARIAARHLAELGHRRFAVLAMPFSEGGSGRTTPERIAAARYASSAERLRGYGEALGAFGVDVAALPVFEIGTDAEVGPALAELFAAPEPPTALLAQSDRIALAALRWLRAEGIAVPERVSVVGFDGVRDGEASTPPLTTVAQPIEEIGRRAVAAILDAGDEVRRERLDATLVVRGSSAPPPA